MTYKFSSKARDDIADIFDYGYEHFGEQRAVRHYDDIILRLKAIGDKPRLYPEVSHIDAGLRRSRIGPSIVYYRIKNDHVLIVRILGRQDTRNWPQGS